MTFCISVSSCEKASTLITSKSLSMNSSIESNCWIRQAGESLSGPPGKKSSYPDNVEITNENAQKGLILEKVIDQLNIKKEEVIVLGDGMNDITLFERFPYSFAPNNAEKVIQEKAYKVVSSCEDGAVSEAIEYALENL